MTSPTLQAVSAAVATACRVPEPRQPLGAVDWPEFVRLVDRHHVAPLVHRSDWLVQAGAPPEVCGEVRERARSDALLSLRLLALQREVLGVLAGAGVDPIVLKGTPLAHDAYGDPTARSPRDLDVLVRPDVVPTAINALRSAGFDWRGWLMPGAHGRPSAEPETYDRLRDMPLVPHVSFLLEGLEVELHWRLFANTRLLPVDPDWHRHPRLVEIQGDAVPALPLSAEWLYMLVHGSDHWWSRMKWLADVPALALRHSQLTQPDALAAVGAGNRRSLATGLLAAEATFGRFLTPASRAWAARVGGTRRLIHRSLRALTADEKRLSQVMPRDVAGEIAGRLTLRRDVRYRREEVRRLLLAAGRAQGVEDPGLIQMAGGPLRWARRVVGRLKPKA